MIEVTTLVSYLDELLAARDFKDPSYNGLQVEGAQEVHKIVSAATASLEAIDEAVEVGADLLLVHHGLFWRGADPRLVGNYYQRVKTLMDNNINLVAYHLPMDAHLQWGNNAYLAHILGSAYVDYIVPRDKSSIALRVRLREPLTLEEMVAVLCQRLDTRVTVLGSISPDMLLDEVAICSGSGSFVLDDNKCPDFQVLITGDVNEQTYHMAEETGTVVLVVGHHASEQEAMHLLAAHVAEQFGLEYVATHFAYEKNAVTYSVGEVPHIILPPDERGEV